MWVLHSSALFPGSSVLFSHVFDLLPADHFHPHAVCMCCRVAVQFAGSVEGSTWLLSPSPPYFIFGIQKAEHGIWTKSPVRCQLCHTSCRCLNSVCNITNVGGRRHIFSVLQKPIYWFSVYAPHVLHAVRHTRAVSMLFQSWQELLKTNCTHWVSEAGMWHHHLVIYTGINYVTISQATGLPH